MCAGDCVCESEQVETLRINSNGDVVAMENAALVSGALGCEDSVTRDGCHATIVRTCETTVDNVDLTVTVLTDIDFLPGGTGTSEVNMIQSSSDAIRRNDCSYSVVIAR